MAGIRAFTPVFDGPMPGYDGMVFAMNAAARRRD